MAWINWLADYHDTKGRVQACYPHKGPFQPIPNVHGQGPDWAYKKRKGKGKKPVKTPHINEGEGVLDNKNIPHSQVLEPGASSNPTEKKKTTQADETLPISIKEKEAHWLRRAVSPLHHKDVKERVLMGIWRVSASTRLQNLTVRSMIVFNSTPSGNKLVDVQNRMGMKLASKFNGTLMVKPNLFELTKGVCNTTGPANTQKDSMKGHTFCTTEFAEVQIH
eukprot:1136917-Pelagomonas_calceolata.AAC.5